MKVCGISDIHGDLYDKIPECDVLCICGDIVSLDIQRDMDESNRWWMCDFAEWVHKLPCKKVIVTPGNHDFFIEKEYNRDWEEFKNVFSVLTNDKLVFLIDESYTYDNIKFYGTPWVNSIPYGNWAFTYDRIVELYDDPKYYDKIPKDTDVLLTHECPYKDLRLNRAILDVDFKAHFFGHWHDSISYGDKKQYNCAFLDSNYCRRYPSNITTVEIDKRKRFLVEELLEDAERSLMQAENEGNEREIEFYTAARDFVLEYFRTENENKENEQYEN